MKKYELTLLLNEKTQDNTELEKAMNPIRDWIVDLGGEIISEENDGRKRLAYSISGEDFAVYMFLNIQFDESNKEFAQKLSSWLNTYEPVLRYLLVQVNEKLAKYVEDDHYKIYSCLSYIKRYEIDSNGEEAELFDEEQQDNNFYEVWLDGDFDNTFSSLEDAKDYIKIEKEKNQRKLKIAGYIRDWVGHMYGTQEMDDPSYDINRLAEYLDEKIN